MAKKLIQDIVVKKKLKTPNKKVQPTIPVSHIIIEEKISPKNTENIVEIDRDIEEKVRIFAKREERSEEPQKIHKNGQRFMWLLVVLSVVAVVFIVSSYFASATVYITPKVVEISATSTLNISTSSPQLGLQYQLLILEDEMSQPITADSNQNVQRKATGQITIYNTYGKTTQRLTNNTRFVATDGKIYRIRESVDVPGYTTVNGQKVPGSIAVDVIADIAGAEYNMKISDLKGDFTIPGFKGTLKYNSFYGRISTDITGGFVGMEKVVSDSKLSKARQDIEDKLKTELLAKATETKPSGYDLLPGSYFFEMTNEDDNSSQVENYIVKTKATLRVFLFNNSDLATFLATKKIKDFVNNTNDVSIIWENNYGVKINALTDRPWNEKVLPMSIFGTAKIIWNIDEDILKKTISGLNKKDILAVIKETFSDKISNVSFVIRPQWDSTFPKDISKIRVENTIVK